jgi:hypothetical protein
MAYEMLDKESAYELEPARVWGDQMTSKKFVDLVVRVHEKMLEAIDAAEL